jgi:hypothetical protein
MQAQEKVALLMTLMRQLQEVMRAENALLRDMRLQRLRALQTEKAALAESYELELRRLRQSPELLAALDPDGRDLLAESMREFQATVTANANRLRQAQQVVEGVVRTIGESLGRHGAAPRGYGAPTHPGADPGRGRVIPVAFDRRC